MKKRWPPKAAINFMFLGLSLQAGLCLSHRMRVALTTASVDMDTFFNLTERSKTVKMKFQHEYVEYIDKKVNSPN